MKGKRSYGDGSIDQRGDGWRLRYRVNGKRFSKTFRGSSSEATKELRRLLRSGDTGEHVAPDRMTVAQWVDHWLSIGAPGRRRKAVRQRALERYGQLLRCHVTPVLGSIKLQQLGSCDIDSLYVNLGGKMSLRTQHHVHVVLGSCLNAAVRKKLLTISPVADAEKIPSPGEGDQGRVLDEDELVTLVQGFRTSTLYPIVATAAFTGARRGEILALRWTDLGAVKKTLRIERAVEETKAYGRTLKDPKTSRGTRTIEIDAGLLDLLLSQREKHARLVAGVPDGAKVNLDLVRLSEGALMFPSFAGDSNDLTQLRDGRAVSRGFRRQARKLGFPGVKFHNLRASHETILLDKGVPVHVVAARCGHDPAVLLRSYAKRTLKADTSAAAVIGAISKGALG